MAFLSAEDVIERIDDSDDCSEHGSSYGEPSQTVGDSHEVGSGGEQGSSYGEPSQTVGDSHEGGSGSSSNGEMSDIHTDSEDTESGSQQQSSQEEQSSGSCDEVLLKKRGTKKRIRQPEKWRRSKSKRRRNSGQKYRSVVNKKVSRLRLCVYVDCPNYTILTSNLTSSRFRQNVHQGETVAVNSSASQPFPRKKGNP